MGKNSAIEWTNHTFNPWWGCAKVSPACKHCYAEKWAHRVGLSVWGVGRGRRFFGDAHWREPLKWNLEASALGVRQRVFCASMADVFEARNELDPWRERLWRLIDVTPMLDWLLLTKRPEQVAFKVPWGHRWPNNVWLGTTVENQLWAERRIPSLMKCAAKVRFISCEPLLGAIDLSPWLSRDGTRGIDWVIAGGESGARSRPMNPVWARDIRDECLRAGVAFHFKQWGNWRPLTQDAPTKAKRVHLDGENGMASTLVRLPKAASGRDLDGRTWDELPRSELSPIAFAAE